MGYGNIWCQISPARFSTTCVKCAFVFHGAVNICLHFQRIIKNAAIVQHVFKILPPILVPDNHPVSHSRGDWAPNCCKMPLKRTLGSPQSWVPAPGKMPEQCGLGTLESPLREPRLQRALQRTPQLFERAELTLNKMSIGAWALAVASGPPIKSTTHVHRGHMRPLSRRYKRNQCSQLPPPPPPLLRPDHI